MGLFKGRSVKKELIKQEIRDSKHITKQFIKGKKEELKLLKLSPEMRRRFLEEREAKYEMSKAMRGRIAQGDRGLTHFANDKTLHKMAGELREPLTLDSFRKELVKRGIAKNNGTADVQIREMQRRTMYIGHQDYVRLVPVTKDKKAITYRIVTYKSNRDEMGY